MPAWRGTCCQFVIEASTLPGPLAEYRSEVARPLREHAEATDAVGPERAALDGRIRSRDEVLAGIVGVGAAEVRAAFARMLYAGPAIGLAGKLANGDEECFAGFLSAAATSRRRSGSPGQ